MIGFTPSEIRLWSRLGSCGAFGLAANDMPAIDGSTVILTADLRFYSGLDRFEAQYPDRLYNVGIAEQNMVGVAAGMAKEGCNVFATTYASFACSRSLDQVRVNMGYMQLPIKLVGLTAGLSVGILGATHMSVEDVSIMRSIPNVTVLSPADCTETVKAVFAAQRHKGPVYIRLTGPMGAGVVYYGDYDFEIGKAITLREGCDIALIAMGTMVYNGLRAADILAEQGLSVKVVDMHTVKPLDTGAIKDCLNTNLLVTAEEHSVLGGLGGAVAEVLAAEKTKPPHLLIGLSDEYKHAGTYEYLMEQYGLTPDAIAAKILRAYHEMARIGSL